MLHWEVAKSKPERQLEWGRGVGHELPQWAIAFHIREMGAEPWSWKLVAKAGKAAWPSIG